MGLLSAAWSREFPAVAFNTIWPQCMVATFAVTNTVGADLALAVSVAHMADPAYRIATSLCHGHHFLDREARSPCTPHPAPRIPHPAPRIPHPASLLILHLAPVTPHLTALPHHPPHRSSR
jgi:hypothetical protein